jgi:hypothetical protein
MTSVDPQVAKRMMARVPELGRWDDLLSGDQEFAFDMIGNALDAGNGLTAKWMPRKGAISIALRKHLGLTPKQYRKLIVNLSDTVEQKMCANEWNSIDFEKVPSVAAARYRRAFERHVPGHFTNYVEAVQRGEAKVNAGVVFPHDVIKGQVNPYGMARLTATERAFIIEQWKALPNFVGDNAILPLVDVSGSMQTPVGGETTALEVAVSLGLYLSDKNKGPFHGAFLTFSARPQLYALKGDVLQKAAQMIKSDWQMNTNLVAAFAEILRVAKEGKVAQADMPRYLLILSDMQFDQCVYHDDSAIKSARRQYEEAGYEMPKVIFWNLAAKSGVPVKADNTGTALVSGFSPAILKSLLANPESFTPHSIMMDTIGKARYDF